MNGFLLDTNIPSELIRKRPEARVVEWFRSADEDSLYLSVITLGELRKGITALPTNEHRQRLEQWLENDLRSWVGGRILPVTESIADIWGRLDGNQQLHGLTLPAADGLIAATALAHDLTVVTRNIKDLPA